MVSRARPDWRSSWVSPTQRMGLREASRAARTFLLMKLLFSLKRWRRSECPMMT